MRQRRTRVIAPSLCSMAVTKAVLAWAPARAAMRSALADASGLYSAAMRSALANASGLYCAAMRRALADASGLYSEGNAISCSHAASGCTVYDRSGSARGAGGGAADTVGADAR